MYYEIDNTLITVVNSIHNTINYSWNSFGPTRPLPYGAGRVGWAQKSSVQGPVRLNHLWIPGAPVLKSPNFAVNN